MCMDNNALMCPFACPTIPLPIGDNAEQSSPAKEITLDQELSKMAKQTAATFAPRASQAKPNPAFKGPSYGPT